MMFARRLVGTHEIAEMFGVSRQRVQQIVRQEDFPKPYDVLHMGKVWRRAAVETWAQRHSRTLADSWRVSDSHGASGL
jgi:predicted DNA-binding transcriptional regulator AlpA